MALAYGPEKATIVASPAWKRKKAIRKRTSCRKWRISRAVSTIRRTPSAACSAQPWPGVGSARSFSSRKVGRPARKKKTAVTGQTRRRLVRFSITKSPETRGKIRASDSRPPK